MAKLNKKADFDTGAKVVIVIFVLLVIAFLVLFIFIRQGKIGNQSLEDMKVCATPTQCNCFDYLAQEARPADCPQAAGTGVSTGDSYTGGGSGAGSGKVQNTGPQGFAVNTEASSLAEYTDTKPIPFMGMYQPMSSATQQYSLWVTFLKTNNVINKNQIKVFVKGDKWPSKAGWCWKTFNAKDGSPYSTEDGNVCGGETGKYLAISVSSVNQNSVDVTLKENIDVYNKLGWN